MSILLKDVLETLNNVGYKRVSSVVKVIEFVSNQSGKRLYIYQNQGFPDHADVIVHPETKASGLLAINGVEPNKLVEFRFGSNMTEFPTRLNKGVSPEHFGRTLYVYSTNALTSLCKEYDKYQKKYQ
jgi:hypothetical protein